tara:strand:+ start:468 stop:1562 length:1095 start_codon:yes stop_codon:yes gene_type:complete
MVNNLFKNKTALITGHTGFKGSWLSAWLSQLGSTVFGFSDFIPTKPSHYEMVKKSVKEDFRFDIRDPEAVFRAINKLKPDFIFHLAAQPIVLQSYKDPLTTFHTNLMGTANVLEGLRKTNHKCTAIFITSDKCYDNLERSYGYTETDRLGGKDPYSGSKGGAELIIRSFVQSFFKQPESNVRLAVGRAGNVIGGGDWAPYRIVPDCIRSWSKNKKPKIRNSFATRPWQHVLEPLSGYLALSSQLFKNKDLNGEAFNFGPISNENYSVKQLIEKILNFWPGSNWIDEPSHNNIYHEAGLLQLNCEKASRDLNWKATLDFEETAQWTSKWYREYYNNGSDSASALTFRQINKYMALADARDSFKLG